MSFSLWLRHLSQLQISIFALSGVWLMGIVPCVSAQQPVKQAQESPEPEPDQPLQTQFSRADLQVMEKLVSIAIHRAPAVRDARAAMGVAPFVDALTIELAPSWLSSSLTDTSDPALAKPYGTSDRSTTLTVTFNPIQLINGLQHQSALHAHLRDAKNQMRVAVMQNYVAYIQTRQSAAVSQRQLETVVASVLAQSQVASIQFDQIPATSILANNEGYIAAAIETLSANGDEMIALETLAATVGLSAQDTLTVIQDVLASSTESQPTAEVPEPEIRNVTFHQK